jgi:hypothetical protein
LRCPLCKSRADDIVTVAVITVGQRLRAGERESHRMQQSAFSPRRCGMHRLHKYSGGRQAAEQGSGNGGESPQQVFVEDPEQFTGMLPSLIEPAEGVKEGHVGRDETITPSGDAAVEIRDSGDQIA